MLGAVFIGVLSFVPLNAPPRAACDTCRRSISMRMRDDDFEAEMIRDREREERWQQRAYGPPGRYSTLNSGGEHDSRYETAYGRDLRNIKISKQLRACLPLGRFRF